MCNLETFAGNGIQVIAFQLFPRRKTDRMDQDVEAVPVSGQFGKHVIDFGVRRDVAGDYDAGTGFFGNFLDP